MGRREVTPGTTGRGDTYMCLFYSATQIMYLRGSSKCSLPQLDSHVLAGHKTRLVVRCHGDVFIMCH